jgi:transcriptional regulator with XRE-family HTH domain
MTRDDRPGSRGLPVHERIRRRREARSMTGVELAKAAGVSPAYISLIEKGVKIPAEEVAEAIARALEDEPELYRAWVHASRYQDLPAARNDLTTAVRISSDRKMRRWLSSGKDVSESPADRESPISPAPAATPPPPRADSAPSVSGMASEIRASLAPPADLEVRRGALVREPPRSAVRAMPELIRVPVLEAGADPGDGPEIPADLGVDDMLLDPRLVGGARLDRPFAFCADAAAVERLRGEARAGDWVVVTSRAGQLEPAAIYAVRLRGRLVLSRVVLKGSVLLLPPGSARSDIDVIEPARGERPERHLAGRVAAVVRTAAAPTGSAR